MTQEIKTIAGTWYTINCTAAVTVTEFIDGEISKLVTLEKSGSDCFRPSGSIITIETEGKFRVLPTKAPAVGVSHGGGGTGAGVGIPAEQLEKLLMYASTEGRNVPIREDGTFDASIGHSYVISTTAEYAIVTNSKNDPLCMITPSGQIGFVANTETCKVSTTDCTVTELFRAAAPISLNGGGVNVSDVLPLGYYAAEFLHNQKQSSIYIMTGLYLSERWTLEMDCHAEVGGSSDGNFAQVYGSGQNNLIVRNYWQTSARINMAGTLNTELPFSANRGVVNVGGGRYSYNNGEQKECTVGTDTTRTVANIFGGAVAVKIYKLIATDGEGESRYFIPAIDPKGEPCFFDQVTKQPFYKSGTGDFAVGMTAEQAAKLANLPFGGGNLTISLPSAIIDTEGNVTDLSVNTAIESAAEKGWYITIKKH